MLDATFKFPSSNPKEWSLTLPIDSAWKNSKRRVLIILQSVDGRDIKAGGVAADKNVHRALVSAIEYSKAYSRKIKELASPSFAVANFQSFRHLHLRGHAKSEAEADFKTRMLAIIEKLQPTHILFSGNLDALYPVANANNKNGWVHKIDNRLVTSTLDFSRLLEKDGVYANLLGFWCRHLAYLLAGKMPFDLSEVKAKPTYINTVEKFDKVMRLWDDAKEVGVDTETRNLSVLHNAIYTIQLAFDTDPTRGFVIPVDHPHSANPFSAEDRKHIKKQLRKRFGDPAGAKLLVTMNGMFDLRVIRQALKLDIIYHPVWEVTAGEHLLDENLSSMASLGTKMGGLAAIYCMYGNDHYLREDTAFSKEDRNTTGNIDPADKGFLEYGATDVVSVLHIRQMQLARSALEELDGKNYKPYFERHMLYQMSDTAHQLSHLKDAGSMIDVKYLKSLMADDSPLSKAINELLDDFRTVPQVVKANKELLDESGFKANSLFGGSTNQWVFSFTKNAHKAKLFFDVMGLKHISTTKTGAPAVDKEFINHYKDRNFIVSMFGEFQESSKLLSTYVKGWYKRLRQDQDGSSDHHLRADFKFFDVDTGRLASGNPNLQNIPARGKLAKVIKEMFITPDNHMLVRFDYSAHEVRGWSIVSGDKSLAEAFKTGQALRQQWIKTPTPEVQGELKKKGDLHIQNVKRFFGKWVEKSDPLRDAVKGVVFGVLYGKSAATLGHDTKKAELDGLKAKIAEAYKSKSPDLKKLEQQFIDLLEEDRTDYAQTVIDKMFNEFQRGHRWVLKMQEMATDHFYVFSPIGRIRHLYAAMTQDRRIVSRQVRRGMNAPIQGFASEIAVKAARLTAVTYYKHQAKLIELLDLEGKYPYKYNRIVHDASYHTVPFEMVLPFTHILQWCSTYGVAEQYHKEFGLKFTVEPEIEMEFGVKDTLSYKWDWSLPQLLGHIDKAVDDGIKLGLYSGSKEEIMEKILAPWQSPKALAYLDKHFPLLGVSLEKEIKDAVRAYRQ